MSFFLLAAHRSAFVVSVVVAAAVEIEMATIGIKIETMNVEIVGTIRWTTEGVGGSVSICNLPTKRYFDSYIMQYFKKSHGGA